MSYKRKSVDLEPEECEALLELIADKIPKTKSDPEEAFYKRIQHTILSTPNHDNTIVLGHKDFQSIIMNSITTFVNLPINTGLSNKTLTKQENTYLAIAHSVIMWLNQNSNLRRTVDFDHTNESAHFEGIDD